MTEKEANDRMSISININGKDYSAEVEARLLLVHFIRDIAGLTGTHVGCDTTHCGACTVLMQDEEQKWRATSYTEGFLGKPCPSVWLLHSRDDNVLPRLPAV